MKGRKANLTLVPPSGGKVPRPDGLTPEAGKIWDRLAPLVPNLQDGHELMLEDFCRTLALLRSERDLLEAEGTVAAGAQGQPIKNPRAQMVRELRQAVMRYASDFGLNPAAAYRMAGGKAKPPEAGEDLLDGNWQPSEAARVN